MAGRRPSLIRPFARVNLPSAGDAFMMCGSSEIDVIVDVTGSVEFGAHVFLEALSTANRWC